MNQEQHRHDRSRTQSFPSDLMAKNVREKINKEEEGREDFFDADDEASSVSNIDSNRNSSSSISRNAPTLMGSIYSLGGSVWKYIRGPVDTDSNDELSGYQRRSRSQSLFSGIRNNHNNNNNNNSIYQGNDDDNCESDSSEAPDFNVPIDSTESIFKCDPDAVNESSSTVYSVTAGRNKIIFRGDSGEKCNLIGRDFPEEEFLLSSRDISAIQSQIPARWKVYSDWMLLYSSRGNGFSLNTLYHQVKPFKGPLILAIKDESSSIFGAFLNQTVQVRQGHYGNGECFLWKREIDDAQFTKFPSTGKNNYFIITEADYLAIGCGNGKFGLWLDKELFQGNSDPVPTFDNDQLSLNPQFDCMAIEIWGLEIHE